MTDNQHYIEIRVFWIVGSGNNLVGNGNELEELALSSAYSIKKRILLS